MRSGTGHIHLLEWKSQVIRRVCRSTLQAESLSMLAGYEECRAFENGFAWFENAA